MNATSIVNRFLQKCGPPLRSGDFPQMLYLREGEFTCEVLTRWTWTEFQEVPAQAAIRNAFAVLQALAEVRR